MMKVRTGLLALLVASTLAACESSSIAPVNVRVAAGDRPMITETTPPVELSTAATVLPEPKVPSLAGDVLFAPMSWELSPAAAAALTPLVKALNGDTELCLHLDAHTDSDGSVDYNMELSRRRLDTVIGWLTVKTANASRITGTAHGEGEPIADNSSAAGRAANRRIEYQIEPCSTG